MLFRSSYLGLSREVWYLSFITLINRAGTMVIPFLSLYLTKEKHYSLAQVGWIMSFFGLGSVVGSWLGGKLTDKIGYYKVMTGSLLLSSVLFVSLQYLDSFASLCFGIFILMCVADAFRPAMFVALNAYSKPENKTRSITLIRLAINLGFAAGPAAGGLIITGIGYAGLFWVDGLSSLIAGLALLQLLHPKKARTIDATISDKSHSAYTDKPYWLFIASMVLFGFIFLQYFSTVPLFYKDIHFLSEAQIGLLIGLNGLIVFILEMPMVHAIEKRKFSKIYLMIIGMSLLGLSFLVLNLTSWLGILIVALVLMSVGEMLVFPFSNSFALEYSKRGKRGEYMALYSIAFSISHVFSHNAGMQSIYHFGFDMSWYGLVAISIIGIFLLLRLNAVLKKEN
ncbi:MAG TPA: MFS transporter [Bacteroidia bacterium]|nr:MFS transporter [Bacteroidia bacterium]HNS12160.1 MFS transporter [Bacteroidia bacterium]